EVYIRITDKGFGIADIEQAMEPLFTTAPEEERSGLGFSVMQSFMDKLKVKSAPDKGTTVTMRKRLSAHGDWGGKTCCRGESGTCSSLRQPFQGTRHRV
ncbi:MAG: ATP-binding protein, partial [Ruminococcus sp.]|nr:ATP-binding protein [Ruminococcus sp.]